MIDVIQTLWQPAVLAVHCLGRWENILYFKIVISWPCFLIVVLHYVKLRHSCVTFTSMRLRRMSMGNKRTRAVMFSVARFI